MHRLLGLFGVAAVIAVALFAGVGIIAPKEAGACAWREAGESSSIDTVYNIPAQHYTNVYMKVILWYDGCVGYYGQWLAWVDDGTHVRFIADARQGWGTCCGSLPNAGSIRFDNGGLGSVLNNHMPAFNSDRQRPGAWADVQNIDGQSYNFTWTDNSYTLWPYTKTHHLQI